MHAYKPRDTTTLTLTVKDITLTKLQQQCANNNKIIPAYVTSVSRHYKCHEYPSTRDIVYQAY